MEHEEFVKKYKNKELYVYIKQTKAVGLILSKYADWHYKPGVIFWGVIAIICFISSFVILLFAHWIYSLAFLLSGITLAKSTMEVSSSLVIKEMVENKIFFHYIIKEKKLDICISERQEKSN